MEDLFRTMKAIWETRPIDPKRDETIRGPVFCSFLALLLQRELEQRREAKGEPGAWAEILRGFDNLQEVEALLQSKRFVCRSQVRGQAHKAFLAAGVALPPALREKACSQYRGDWKWSAKTTWRSRKSFDISGPAFPTVEDG